MRAFRWTPPHSGLMIAASVSGIPDIMKGLPRETIPSYFSRLGIISAHLSSGTTNCRLLQKGPVFRGDESPSRPDPTTLNFRFDDSNHRAGTVRWSTSSGEWTTSALRFAESVSSRSKLRG